MFPKSIRRLVGLYFCDILVESYYSLGLAGLYIYISYFWACESIYIRLVGQYTLDMCVFIV